MTGKGLLKTGAATAGVAGTCCFTPVLVLALGALGLTAVVGSLDYVLLPAMAAGFLMMGYGIWKRKKTA